MDSGYLHDLKHDMIIGRDLMKFPTIIIDFKNQVIQWDGVTVSMNRIKIVNQKKMNLEMKKNTIKFSK